MAKQKDFNTFLSNIEPSSSTVSYISSVQNNLRDYLASHPNYKEVYIQTFLSGSYAKHTAIRPKLYDGKRDVDIVVETSYNSMHNSIDVIQEIHDTLKEKEIYSNAKIQSHSVGIELEGISIDVVPVICSNDGERYCIGSSDCNEWIITDPKGHISWSSEVNVDNSMKYKPIVKILKWWRRSNCPEDTKYPKGITLEKMIADNLPDLDFNIEDHLVGTMQSIVDSYRAYIDAGIKPIIYDPCISENDLLAKYELIDIESFILKLSEHLDIINQDGVSNESWRKIFGKEFPKDDSDAASSFERCAYNDTEQFIETMFPVQINYNLVIDCNVTQDGWRPFSLSQFLVKGGILRHNKKLDFFIRACNVTRPYNIYWKVRNVGEVAESRNCIRGQIYKTDHEHQIENTNFYGPHFVECYIVKNGICVARNRIDVPIGES